MSSIIACKWLGKAVKDLKWAEIMLAEGDTDYSTFHSQQPPRRP